MTNDARTELRIDDLMDRGERGVPVREMGALLGWVWDELGLAGEREPG